MCLRSKDIFIKREVAQKRALSPTIAKKDIVVYKGLDKVTNVRGCSPYNIFYWDKGFRYTEVKRGSRVFGTKIDRRGGGYQIVVNRGFHACTSRSRAKSHGAFVIKMIIPKGSRYILGSSGDIVTNNLIWY